LVRPGPLNDTKEPSDGADGAAPNDATPDSTAPDSTDATSPVRAQPPSGLRPQSRPSKPSAWTSTQRYLLDRRRRPAVLLGLVALVGLVAFGVYAVVAGPPPTVEAVVVFKAETTDAQKEAVRAACPTVGGAIQEPRDANNLALTRAYPLRYNLTKASTADRAKIFECVQRQPGVTGITTETQGQ